MSGKAPAEAGRLVITLVRGLAGKRQVYKDTCQVLGLNKTWRKTEKPNNASVRGMVQKVRHLVKVETKEAYDQRMVELAASKALRPPIVVKHS
mmetsp:Transcript_17029/g.30428  ORF Transcript_17029/g.30428 Transcript_17029/m.30428 type:complete len:93 (-) Transcript_17029:271-549(-)